MLRKKTPPWKGESLGPMIVACKDATENVWEVPGVQGTGCVKKRGAVTAGLRSLGGGLSDLPVEQVLAHGACTARRGRVLADVLQLLLDPLGRHDAARS